MTLDMQGSVQSLGFHFWQTVPVRMEKQIETQIEARAIPGPTVGFQVTPTTQNYYKKLLQLTCLIRTMICYMALLELP